VISRRASSRCRGSLAVYAPALCVAVLVLLTACGDWTPAAALGWETVTQVSEADDVDVGTLDEQFSVSSALVSAELLETHDMVSVEGDVVVMASSRASAAGTILRSEDGGVSWSESTLPDDPRLADDDPGEVSGDLIAAGPWVVALQFGDTGQAVSISSDHGASWQPLFLPVPDGVTPVVFAAAELDGQLVLGGMATEDEHFDDAALWIGGAWVFQRLPLRAFDNEPSDQMITELVHFDGRLIAVGTADRDGELKAVAWEGRLGGLAWTDMGGLPVSSYSGSTLPAVITGGQLALRFLDSRARLAPGSSTWVLSKATEPALIYAQADELALSDGSVALTLTDSHSCSNDCSSAYGGRIDNGVLTPTDLSVGRCGYDDNYYYARVSAPVLMDGQVVAVAECDGARLVHSADGGATWTTLPLEDADPEMGPMSVLGRYSWGTFDESVLSLPDGALLALVQMDDTLAEAGESGFRVAQVLAMRISAPG